MGILFVLQWGTSHRQLEHTAAARAKAKIPSSLCEQCWKEGGCQQSEMPQLTHTQRGGTTRSHRVPAALGTPQRGPAAGTGNVLWDAQQRREGSVLVRAGSCWGGSADSLRALAASPEEGSWRGRAAP